MFGKKKNIYGEPVVPDEEGYVNLTLTADLTPSEKQQLINLLN